MPAETRQNKTGRLFLIPNIIHPDTEAEMIAPIIISSIRQVDYYLVEKLRTARRYLSTLMKTLPKEERAKIADLEFEVLDKNTSMSELERLIQPVRIGRSCGIISESGCPGIADPGSEAVRIAHKWNVQVVPLPGPSSIFMALMASGMNGQEFAFHGYLPIDKRKLISKIKQMEQAAIRNNQTQIFIETPYRNQRIYDFLLATCQRGINLCIARNISGPDAFIKTLTIGEWKSKKIAFSKVPVVFLISA